MMFSNLDLLAIKFVSYSVSGLLLVYTFVAIKYYIKAFFNNDFKIDNGPDVAIISVENAEELKESLRKIIAISDEPCEKEIPMRIIIDVDKISHLAAKKMLAAFYKTFAFGGKDLEDDSGDTESEEKGDEVENEKENESGDDREDGKGNEGGKEDEREDEKENDKGKEDEREDKGKEDEREDKGKEDKGKEDGGKEDEREDKGKEDEGKEDEGKEDEGKEDEGYSTDTSN